LLEQIAPTVRFVAGEMTLLAVVFATLIALAVTGWISGFFRTKKRIKWAYSLLFAAIGLGALGGAVLTLAGFTLPFHHGRSADGSIIMLSAYFWILCSVFAFMFSGLEFIWRNSRN
jgi:hypothetical protein